MDELPEELPAKGKERGRVGFFLGCAMNLVFADVSRDTVEVLRRAGYTVVTPRDQQCCGTPNIAEGERHVYRDMAEHNIRLFEGRKIDAVITDCAACGCELKTYGLTLSHTPGMAKRAAAFSASVRDISEFLDRAFGEETVFGPIDERVCFHDPCHLRHGQKLVSPQRSLLRRIPGLDLCDIPDEGQCCGAGGIYNITHTKRSMKILDAKVAAIRKTGAQSVVTANPGCLMQLRYASDRAARTWTVSHISQLLRVSLDRAGKHVMGSEAQE
jgi:glycolate oxidase iron-sulfur subunit